MISITVSNATLILGAHTIFRELNWEIQHDQKIGLIGPNGAGKSSLLKLIIEEHSPEKGGSVIRARGVTVGYLPQHPEFDPGRTAISLALEGNPRVLEIDLELLRLEEKLGDPEVYKDGAKVQGIEAEREALRGEVQGLYQEWERLAAELEALNDAD